MNINGKEITFHLNLKASKKIAEICPGRDLKAVDRLFDAEDSYEFIDNICTIAIAMSMNRQNDEPLTEADIEELDFTQLPDLITELRKQFRADRGTTVEVKPIKKKDTEAKESSSG